MFVHRSGASVKNEISTNFSHKFEEESKTCEKVEKEHFKIGQDNIWQD